MPKFYFGIKIAYSTNGDEKKKKKNPGYPPVQDEIRSIPFIFFHFKSQFIRIKYFNLKCEMLIHLEENREYSSM